MVVADGPVISSGALAGWQPDPVSVAGLAVEVLLAATYLYAAARAGRRRRRRPLASATAFLSGLATLAVVLQSGLAAHDHVYWVHTVQHVVVMSVAPVLLALGAPVTLCLQVLPTGGARRVVGVLHRRPVQALCGRWAAGHVPLAYYGLAFAYLLTPWYALSLRNEVVHVATHALMLTCGMLFWVPIVGCDPARWRPAHRTRIAAAAAGIPVNAVLAGAVGSWAVLGATEFATLLGVLVVIRYDHRPPVRAVPRQRRRVVVTATADVS